VRLRGPPRPSFCPAMFTSARRAGREGRRATAREARGRGAGAREESPGERQVRARSDMVGPRANGE
jgi:hypothetical protein